MAYVPPHLRVSQDGRPKPEPVAPPSSTEQYLQSHARSNRGLVADVRIQKSADFIRRYIVLSCHQLQFTKFEGDTYAHLCRHQLYTLKFACKDDDEANGSQGVDGLVDRLSLEEVQHPASFIIGSLQKDLRELLEKFRQYASAESIDKIVPSMKLRLGKMICHSRSGLIDWQKTLTTRDVEMSLETGNLSCTFDNCILEEEFVCLCEHANKSAEQTLMKERFIIQVSDEMKPDTHILCVCSQGERKEESDHIPKSHVESNLDLQKVKMRPVRHLISDIACVGKSRDVRMMFYIKEYVTWLNENEVSDLKTCISKASVDETVKGGLRWPLGAKHSTSGRFKVVGSVHEKETLVISEGLRWSLQRCNRIEFKASSGRISYEVAVRPITYHEFCKGRKDQTVEELLLSFEGLLRRIWADCIS